jgi:hypothetical protein
VATADYFKRVWIVQEIILGKTNVCQVGDQLYSLAVLTAAVEVLCCFDSRQLPPLSPEGVAINNGNIESVVSSHFRPALKSCWVHITSERQHDVGVVTTANKGSCSDARDHIYGVASLFRESNGYEIDYTLSEAEVFSDFTIHSLVTSQALDVLNQDRLNMGSIYAVDELRRDLPSWCPDWSVAGRGDDVLFRSHGLSWQACGTNGLVYSRPSRTTLALKGLAVHSIKLCSDCVLECFDFDSEGESQMTWFARSEDMCSFFGLQDPNFDQNAKDTIFRIFERILPPERFAAVEPHPAWFKYGVSHELRALLDSVRPSDLVALLAPVYLARVDPELFDALGLEIDARLSPGDYPTIRSHFGRILTSYGAGTRLFVTEDGKHGAGYPGIRSGDLICVIYGSKTPQILRRVDDDAHERYQGGRQPTNLQSGL